MPWTAVRSGAEIGLQSLRLSIPQGASLGDLLHAPTCPIEKVTLWVGFIYLTSRSETDEGVAKDKVLPELRIEPGTPGLKSTLSTRLSLHSNSCMRQTNK